jgi:hypothetical protein
MDQLFASATPNKICTSSWVIIFTGRLAPGKVKPVTVPGPRREHTRRANSKQA